MTPCCSISPVQTRAWKLSQEIVRKRESLRIVQMRLGTAAEQPDDFEQARHLAHALGSLVQETVLASYLLKMKSAELGAELVGAAK
jgi:hypothetical protein